MKNKKQVATIVRWIARICGTLSLIFMLFFVVAHVIGSVSGKGEPLGDVSISFVFFPVSLILGLATALKWEGLGGIITVVGIIGFHIFRPDLIFDLMIDGLAAPAIFYILSWYLSRKTIQTK